MRYTDGVRKWEKYRRERREEREYLKKNSGFLSWPNWSNVVFRINHRDSKTSVCDGSYPCSILGIVADCEWDSVFHYHTLAYKKSTQRNADNMWVMEECIMGLRRYPAHCNANSLLEDNFSTKAEVFQISITRLMKWSTMYCVDVSLEQSTNSSTRRIHTLT